MKGNFRQLLACVLAVMLIIPCFGTAIAASPLELPDLISDNMLIQRDMPIKLWGYGGTPGDALTVQIEDKKGVAVSEGTTTIGEDGFSIELPAMEAGGPYTIRFLNDKGEKLISVYNVLVGDLWFQGGQSNMQYGIGSIPQKVTERVSPNPKDDTIRLFYNGRHFSADEPATDLEGKWVVADKNLLDYSAVGYKALETIHNELDIPVGGICSPYGGSGLNNFNKETAGIYKAKVAPVTQFNIKGVMWYQGETDSANGVSAEDIESRYKQLVSLFRDKWNNEKLPFIIPQIHQSQMRGLVYGSTTDYIIFDYSPARIAQSNLYMTNENVGMAVTMDLSLQKYKDAGEDPEHPWIKAPVGERLGNVALEMVYGKDIKSKSPVYTGYSIDGNAVKITVQDEYDGLKTSDGKDPWGFMIAGEDGVYYEAKASLSGNTITLTSDKVASPVTASYGIEKHIWPYTDLNNEEDIANAPELPAFLVNVVNSVGLPLGAFDTSFNIALGGAEVQTPPSETEDKTDFVPVEVKPVEQSGDRILLYVAPDGNDKNAGTIDKPLASIVGARDKIREIKKSDGMPEGGIVVYFREGTYPIKKGVTFTDEDSGTEDARITYRNYPDEEVTFVGAASLSWDDFTPVTDEAVLNRIVDKEAREHIYSVNLKKLGFNNLQPPVWPGPYSYEPNLMKHLTPKYGITQPENETSELIVNGKTMTIARYPNEGYMTITEVIEDGWHHGGGLMSTEEADFVMPDDTKPIEVVVADKRIQNWVDAKGAIMYGTFCYTWASQATEVGSINVKENAIKAKYPIWYNAVNGQNFYVFNLIEEIDMPGEYYIDVDKGILYIYEPDEPVEEVAYTVLDDTMLTFDGADYVTLKNIDIKYTKRAAFFYNNGSDYCELIGSEISYAGYYNYLMGTNNKILDCYVHDNGYGIELKGGERPTLTRANNLLENSKFERNDRTSSTYSPAVALTRCGNAVRYCDISDADHLLVSFSGNYQELSYCNIYNACMHADDMGAIYAGRDITQRGNLIQYNYIHDIGGGTGVGSNGTHGIFLDDWWSAADIAGNVFANIPDGAAVMLAGSYNVMDNNIVVDCSESFRLTRSFAYGNPDNYAVYAEKAQNIPYTSELWKNAFPGIENLFDQNGAPDMNNYIVCTNNVLFGSGMPRTSEQVAATATLENNVTFTKDPGFYDALNGNYLLKEDSEVFEKIPGFKPIPFTRMGTYSDRAINRIKKAHVFHLESPYVYKNGERVKSDKTEAIVENGTMYVPLRSGAEAAGATVAYYEDTQAVSVTTGAKTLEFVSGSTDTAVKVNGSDYTLSKPIVKIDGANYIAIEDVVNIFEKQLITHGNIAVISDIEQLFYEKDDDGLLRYIGEQLTVF